MQLSPDAPPSNRNHPAHAHVLLSRPAQPKSLKPQLCRLGKGCRCAQGFRLQPCPLRAGRHKPCKQFSCTSHHRHQLLPRWQMHWLLGLLRQHRLLLELGLHHRHRPQGTCGTHKGRQAQHMPQHTGDWSRYGKGSNCDSSRLSLCEARLAQASCPYPPSMKGRRSEASHKVSATQNHVL